MGDSSGECTAPFHSREIARCSDAHDIPVSYIDCMIFWLFYQALVLLGSLCKVVTVHCEMNLVMVQT